MNVRLAWLLYLAVINIAAFAVFGWDKKKARWGGWRIPEKTLLLLALIGGSIGAWKRVTELPLWTKDILQQ